MMVFGNNQRIHTALILDESPVVRWLLIGIALVFMTMFLILPLTLVFTYAFRDGVAAYIASIVESDSLSAIRLTLITASIAVPVNTLFGVSAAWAIAKFNFRGKNLLITLVDLPFAISPIVAGTIFILLFGARGWSAPLLAAWDLQIIFTPIAIVMVTLFGTMPFVLRELIPLMQAQGTQEEQAALTLGANGFQTFYRVTLPNIKWGLIYGIILCNARAMGEFGSIYVISGRIRGETNTIPLHIEVLYNDYMLSAAFAMASLLTFLALVTLAVKSVIEWKVASNVQYALDEIKR